jgi:hypothetical protein
MFAALALAGESRISVEPAGRFGDVRVEIQGHPVTGQLVASM